MGGINKEQLKPRSKVIITSIALVVFSVFIVCVVILGANDVDDYIIKGPGDRLEIDPLVAIKEDINEPSVELVDELHDLFYLDEGSSVNLDNAKELLYQVSDDVRVDIEIRGRSLNALADICDLAFDIGCLNELRPKFVSAGIDTKVVDDLIESISGFQDTAGSIADPPEDSL